MTTYLGPVDITRTCYLCGETTTFSETYLTSTSRFGGSPFMDTHSFEDYTMAQYEVCPHCGYVAYDISKKVGSKRYLKHLVESQTYKEGFPIFSGRAPITYRRYLLSMECGDYDSALGEILLCYMCNDKSFTEAERIATNQIRYLIIALLKKKREELESPGKRNFLMLQIIDLYRRAGHFDEVKRLAECSIEHDVIQTDMTEEDLNEIIKFELEKAEKKDMQKYTFDDVFNPMLVGAEVWELYDIFPKLTAREQKVVRELYEWPVEEPDIEGIMKKFGISERRVYNIIQKAKRILRESRGSSPGGLSEGCLQHPIKRGK